MLSFSTKSILSKDSLNNLGKSISSFTSGISAKSLIAKGVLNDFGPLGKTVSSFVNKDIYENVPTKNLKLSNITIDHLYNTDHTVSDFGSYIPMTPMFRHTGNFGNIIFEDPNKFDIVALTSMNTYRFRYKNNIKNVFDSIKDGKGVKVHYSQTDATPALFNPQYGIQTIGITQRVPLLNGVFTEGWNMDDSPYDCSIRKLCSDSLNFNGPLGVGTYRIVDFMYCKDLGKVPNNRLITLRRFAFPVGDHIGKFTAPKYSDDIYNFDTPGDVGRLISWFDTDDNKLEDICRYEMKMSWKEIKSKIQEIESKEENEQRGIIGMLGNTINPRYNSFNDKFGGQKHNILSALGTHLGFDQIGIGAKANDHNYETLRMSADNNKVYTPKNTVQDTHLYEGALTLNQEITLNFSYKLRAYDNINPKSAFLDLMGNILNVTYKRGSYWAGSRRLIGPPRNMAAWSKANAFIDNAWHKMGGFVESMAAGTLDFNGIMGSIANAVGYVNDMLNAAVDGTKKLLSMNKDELVQSIGSGIKKLNDATGMSKYLKGMLKDSLGRPALYAMDSLISGDDCGFWHLTVGNPYNPIMSIGNLIMTSASVQHMGPLGIDDFPSEIKVTVTLKPGRSRDLTEISRYYTQGVNSIYISKTTRKIEKYHNFNQSINGESALKLDEGNLEAAQKKKQAANNIDVKNNNLQTVGLSVSESENLGLGDADTYQRKLNDQLSGYNKENSNNMYLSDGWSGLIYATNNYSALYHLRSYDEIDYA